MNFRRRALELFEQAIALPEQEIAQFLDSACDRDEELRGEVESLLASSKQSESFLPSPGDLAVDQRSTTDGAANPIQDTDAFRLQPGSVLMGRYAVRELIGTGGMGEVYRANDVRLGREVAIKVLSRASMADPVMRDRFEREMRSVAPLSHPNVVSLYDVGDHHGCPLAVMELLEGTILRELIREPMPWAQAVDIALGIASGLTAAHERDLMHRDIKPENVVVSPNGHVKILDFGLARQQNVSADQNLTHTSIQPGTIPYMSPEQAEGGKPGCPTDIFSLGTVLYEMLTGANPFRGESAVATLRRVADASHPMLSQCGVDVPDELDALVSEMLQRDPSQRPSAKAVVLRLRSIRSAASRDADAAVDVPPSASTLDTDHAGEQTTSDAIPTTRYARCGDVHIAYQVFGDGPANLVIAPGFISNVDNSWTHPLPAGWLRGFGRFARVAVFDKRGTGLSDRVSSLPDMEERMEDVTAVMDAVGFESAAILGVSEGGCLATLFAATYPQRCQALILYGAFARFKSWIGTDELLERLFEYIRSNWGTGKILPKFAPSMAGDREFQQWWGRFERLGADPGSAIALMRMNSQIDLSGILATIRRPTLVVHREEDVLINSDAGRFLAEHIPGARLLMSPGPDHLPWVSDAVESETMAVREFLDGLPDFDASQQLLATVLAIRLNQHSSTADDDEPERQSTINRIRDYIERHQGSAMTPYAQGVLSTFDGPARALRCAKSIANAANVSVGVHTGEISLGESVVKGVAVDIAANIANHADDGEVIVSRTVTDLVAGSGLQFAVARDRRLEGAFADWRLYRVM